MSVTIEASVEGMTCGHCVKSVTEEISALAGVTDVAIDLVVDGKSVVTISAEETVPTEKIAEAVEEAGYSLVEATTLS